MMSKRQKLILYLKSLRRSIRERTMLYVFIIGSIALSWYFIKMPDKGIIDEAAAQKREETQPKSDYKEFEPEYKRFVQKHKNAQEEEINQAMKKSEEKKSAEAAAAAKSAAS